MKAGLLTVALAAGTVTAAIDGIAARKGGPVHHNGLEKAAAAGEIGSGQKRVLHADLTGPQSERVVHSGLGGSNKRVIHSDLGGSNKRVVHSDLADGPKRAKRDGPGVVGMDFRVKRTPTESSPGTLVKRDGEPVSLSLANDQMVSYLAELEIGSDSQKVDIVLDTGSSDLWVMASTNPYCTDNVREILTGEGVNCTDITFDYESSSSWSFNSSSTPEFEIQYGDGSAATGRWGQDTVKFGGITLEKANLALGEESNSSACVFGIGFIENESTADFSEYSGPDSTWPPPGTYDNVPVQMKNEGLIDKVAYSLWLDQASASTGQILFGGVDHAKYNGTLQILPIVESLAYVRYDFPSPLEFNIVLNSITAVAAGGASVEVMSDTALPALLDSGTSFVYLPEDVAEAIAASLQAFEFTSGSGWYTDCALGDAGSLRYSFSGVEINVPLSEMLVPLTSDDGTPLSENGVSYCQLALMAADDTIILGDSFLRAAYVVYDLEKNEIALAQAVTGSDASDSNVEAISSDIPSATTASGYSSTSFTTRYSATYSTIFSTPTGDVSARISGGISATARVSDASATGSVATGTASSSGSSGSSTRAASSSSSSGAASPVGFSPVAALAAFGLLLF